MKCRLCKKDGPIMFHDNLCGQCVCQEYDKMKAGICPNGDNDLKELFECVYMLDSMVNYNFKHTPVSRGILKHAFDKIRPKIYHMDDDS